MIECWYTRADKLPKKGKKADVNGAQTGSRRVFEQIQKMWSSIRLRFLYKLTEIGLVLTALDLHSPWSCLNEEVSHQLFQWISWESTQEQGEGSVSRSKENRRSCYRGGYRKEHQNIAWNLDVVSSSGVTKIMFQTYVATKISPCCQRRHAIKAV